MKYCITLVLLLLASLSHSSAQGTAFFYQGQLSSDTSPATGSYDFRFKLYYDAQGATQAGSAYATNAIAVNHGLFATTVNFGPDVFAGSNYWLEIDVRTNNSTTYTVLSPLQGITPVPYAIFAAGASNLSGSLPARQVSGTLAMTQLPSGVVTNNSTGLALTGTFNGNGAGLTGLNAGQLANGTVPDARLAGDVALTDAGQTFTGGNTFNTGTNSGGQLLVTGSTGIDTTSYNGLGLQYYNGTGEGALVAAHNNAAGFLTFYTKPGSGFAPALHMLLDADGGLHLDQQNLNSGVINNGSVNGAALTFGTASGEGIASQRQTGTGNNLDGIDFYTGYSNRMSLAHNGTLNINGAIVLPAQPLLCNGAATNVFLYANTNNNDTVLGVGALPNLTNAGGNTVFGAFAMYGDASGYDNTAVGLSALTYNYSGSENTAIGKFALCSIYNGSQNTAVGSYALSGLGYYSNSSGSNNIAIGYGAGGGLAGGESGNIDIGNPGNFGENNTTRIGVPGVQTSTFLAGLVETDGGIVVDDLSTNAGGLSSNALLFGGAPGYTGEGIASKRTPGGTQNDLELITDFSKRLVVLNNGDVGVGNTAPTHLFEVGNAYCDGNSWSPASDRNLKSGFTPVDAAEVLAKVAALPISRWYYTNNAAAPHMGPMAQDFHAAFGTGADDRHIADVDEGGVALAAIQGLNRKVEEKDALIQTQSAEIADLKSRLEKLEQLMEQHNGGAQ